ncbi:MAG: DUF2156 domain-containing protein [Treponema sp.]|jgi:hypothetical protein|nr:DUF2156 domain-containing protein [Treponema sp.]
MPVPCYPVFAPLEISLRESLHPRLSLTVDGVSEFTFSGLYLFRNRYKYRISHDGPDGGFIISGEQPAQSAAQGAARNKTFFMTPCGVPKTEILEALFETHDYWKNVSESVLSPVSEKLLESGITIAEDRDNFDYLYYRGELAELTGKKFHKKKNLVNQFLHNYPEHEQRPMTASLVPAAVEILDRWRQDKALSTGENGDYTAAREALDMFDILNLRGSVFFVNGKPAAYCLGESIAKGKMFAIHFEKAVDEYKGIYQFMNQAFAAALPRFFTWINREQDLGDEGLRHAKTSYRPCGFVQKYTGKRL